MQVFPPVERKFSGRFPPGHVNGVRGWAFTKEEIASNKGRLLTMDIDLPGKAECSLNCRGICFRRTKAFQSEKRFSMAKFKETVLEAKSLGLKSAKFIGPGEPLEEKNLLGALEFFSKNGLIPLIFTKGNILSERNEEKCKQVHGVGTAGLIAKFREYGASILLAGTSFIPGAEDAAVDRKGYCIERNEALERLVDADLSNFVPGSPTQLTLISAPVTPRNIGEMFGIYRWARKRHIYHVLTPTMVAGQAKGNIYNLVIPEKEIIDLYVKINVWSIKNGMFSFSELQQQGISPYAGAAPCNQVGCGLFVLGSGKVLRCPGDDTSFQGDLNRNSLAQIWQRSENMRVYSGQYNNGCPPKEGISFPAGFFGKVMSEVKRLLESI